MISLARYFEYKKDITKMLVIIEHESTIDLLIRLCHIMPQLSTLYVASTSAQKIARLSLKLKRAALFSSGSFYLPENIQVQDKNFLHDSFNKSVDTILFDSNVKRNVLISARRLKPIYLIGKLWRDFVPCFSLWESYRDISQHIYLECISNQNKTNILNWEKNPTNDVELSVVFPVYNVEKYLVQCIETVTAWKAPYIEFLFVNDGSPDNSRDIILKYQKCDNRIKLIDKPNGGCASARKRGLDEAQGKYIGFIDPDDFIEKDMFKKLLCKALIGSYDISYCGYNVYYESSGKAEKIADALSYPYILGTTDKSEIQKLIVYLRVAIWRGIYRTEFLRENHISFLEDIRRFDDLPFKIETLSKAKSVIATPEHLYYYRLERPGQDVACNDERLFVHFDIFRHLDNILIEKKDQKILDLLQLAKVQTHCFTISKIQRQLVKEYCKQARNDFKANGMTIRRTLILMYRYFRFDNMLAYLSIMFGLSNAYIRHLERKRIR